MKFSEYFLPTRREEPKEAEIPSHRMMLRAGLIRQHAAGIYSLLPLGWKILRKIMDIIREEMEDIGCLEFHLPALTPSEIWEKSGRWETFGDDMFRLKDRKGRELCLAPTHEEVFTEIAAGNLRSYRDLPQMWYQIQTKFRDEVRPRSGLLRVRQFFMKDAYSFDWNIEGLDRSYDLQREAYLRIFKRAGLDVVVVKASSGAMGGRDCEEYMVLSPSGDDEVVHCSNCGYSANQEVAESVIEKVNGPEGELKKVYTPEKRTIDEVAGFLGISPALTAKSLIYSTPKGLVFVMMRGDHEADEGKLAAVIGESRPAEPEEIKAITGAEPGFVSPVRLKGIRVIADKALEGVHGIVAGANETDYHLTGVDVARDMDIEKYISIKSVVTGEACTVCGNTLEVARGIEVGHIFKLGTRYSEALGAYVLDDKGESLPIIMGSYGIGVERIMASAVETHFDGEVMVWPREIAPFLVQIVPLNVNNPEISDIAKTLYDSLRQEGIDVLLDDRDERAGVKFKDADLFGAPIEVIIGEKNLREGLVELRIRDIGKTEMVSTEDVYKKIVDYTN